MKKLFTLSMLLVAFAFTATFASAQSYFPQQNRNDRERRDDRNDRWNDRNDRNNRGVRTVTKTRIVRQGFRTFRETVQIKYFPNGKVTTRVISRTRIR